MKKTVWVCDHCQINKVTKDNYLPEGWIRDRRSKPYKHYHGEKCLLAELTPQEQEEYNGQVWMA